MIAKLQQHIGEKLKQRLKDERNETVTNRHGLKLRAVDSKMRLCRL